jgi:hypothetical protein
MRFISGLPVAAALATLLASGAAGAGGPEGGGPGHPGPAPGSPPRQGIGVNAYAPGQGPVGVAAWNGGNWDGYSRNGFLPWGGGVYDASTPVVGGGGPGAVSNIVTYNHFDNRRRDGGFYGGGGVFYGDDGYSRLPPPRETGCVEGVAARSGSPHVIELPDQNDPPPAPPKPARRGARR